MSSHQENRYQRALTRLKLWWRDELVRILFLFFLASSLGVSAILHFHFVSDASGPERIHIALLGASFFVSVYLSLRSSI